MNIPGSARNHHFDYLIVVPFGLWKTTYIQNYLVISTHPKNTSQIGNLPQIGVVNTKKNKHHHLVTYKKMVKIVKPTYFINGWLDFQGFPHDLPKIQLVENIPWKGGRRRFVSSPWTHYGKRCLKVAKFHQSERSQKKK